MSFRKPGTSLRRGLATELGVLWTWRWPGQGERANHRGRRALALCLVTLAVVAPLVLSAQFRYRNPAYDAHFVFSRIQYGSGLVGFGRFGGGAWAHDYPSADVYLTEVLDDLTRMRVRAGQSNVLDLDDPALFENPIIYVSEPGFRGLADSEAARLREYLLKGGFVIFDDFEGPAQWQNMADQMARALPERRFVEIGVDHPIFHAFFNVNALDVPHPSVNVQPVFYAMFENDDPRDRMIALANYNSDLAEYWEWSARDVFPPEITSGAYELGVNYIVYGMTH
jgi:hypothetical protein